MWMNFFENVQKIQKIDHVKESYFRRKMSKITKGQIFCTIFNFFDAHQPNCWPFWGPGIYCNNPFHQSLYNNSLLVTPIIDYL